MPEASIPYAKTPFDDPQADVILRSNDKVDFRSFKILLAMGSPVFRAMFELPSPQPNPYDEMRDNLVVVPLEEDSICLYALLTYCYPLSVITVPTFQKVEHVFDVLKAAIKYSMDGVEREARRVLREPRFMEVDPLRLFALSVYHRLEDEARTAAKKTLRLPLLSRGYVEELEIITAGTLHRLQQYHIKCGEVAHAVVNDLSWVQREDYVWFDCNDCRNARTSVSYVTISGNRRKWVVSKWWTEYLADADMAVTQRPSGYTVTSPELVDEALGKASLCKTCRSKAFAEMREFSQLFAAAVDEATNQMSLELQFS